MLIGPYWLNLEGLGLCKRILCKYPRRASGLCSWTTAFVLFISLIANVINPDQSNQNNTVSFHQYADDTQLYIGTNSSTLTTQIASIESESITGFWIMVFIWTLPSQRPSPFTTPDPNLWLLWLSRWERSRLLALLLSFKHQLKIWVFTLTQKCHLINRCLKHARLVISIFVPCVTFVLLLLPRLLKP